MGWACNLMKEGFDSETVYYEKYLKFKIKYDDKIQIFMRGFCKERSHCLFVRNINRCWF